MVAKRYNNLPKQFFFYYKYLHAQKIWSQNRQNKFIEHASNWPVLEAKIL